jgi:hypothetical protein
MPFNGEEPWCTIRRGSVKLAPRRHRAGTTARASEAGGELDECSFEPERKSSTFDDGCERGAELATAGPVALGGV